MRKEAPWGVQKKRYGERRRERELDREIGAA